MKTISEFTNIVWLLVPVSVQNFAFQFLLLYHCGFRGHVTRNQGHQSFRTFLTVM